MLRTALFGSVAAALLAWSWGRLELGETRGLIVPALLLGVAPFLVPTRLRVPAAVVAAACVARVALGTWSPRGLVSRFSDGFLRYYDVSLPFNQDFQPRMYALVLLAVLAFTFAVTFAVAARRPLLAAAILVGGAAWPLTLLQGDSPLTDGALILAAALAIIGGLSASPRVRQAVVAGGVVTVAAVAVATVPAVAQGAFLGWENWDPYTKPDLPVSVDYVWNTTYQPLNWPKKKTVVFRVEGPPVSRYWRATTLDEYSGEYWLPYSHPVSFDEPVRDPLLPSQAFERGQLIEAEVTIEALQDQHLVGASVPIAFDAGADLGPVFFLSTGTATVPGGLERDARYTATSLAIRPAPRALARSEPRYTRLHDVYRSVQSRLETPLPPAFGTRNRDDELAALFETNAVYARYQPLYELARDVVGGTRSPYIAAVRLEDWFRSGGGFRYDASVSPSGRGETLVDFVTRTRRGHCQYFAGAMALMLRYLGIPARVAAGFTSGRYNQNDGEWVVTDHEAHTWVEVWFDGFGWLPFDPTPGRGSLDGAYSSSSVAFSPNVINALDQGRDPADAKLEGAGLERTSDAPTPSRDLPGDVGVVTTEQPSLLRLLALVALGLLTALLVVKYSLRRARFLTRDARKVAAACRRELADFLVDQRVAVPSSATVAELGEIARRHLDVNADPFVDAVTAARYGPLRDAPRNARVARRELRRLERQARKRLSRFERARGLVSVRSLGVA